MEQFLGDCVSRGLVFGAVSRVLEGFGIAALPSARMTRVTDALERDPLTPVEVEDIILVARRPPLSLLHGNVAGYKIVGLALSDYPDEGFEPGVPCVCGLGEGFLAGIKENDLILIDGNASSVILDPDASLVAQYQAPLRRTRYFLDDAHLHAKTASDNRVIAVFADLAGESAVDDALQQGADGFCLRTLSPYIVPRGSVPTVAGQKLGLAQFIDCTAGLPLLIDLPFEDVALTVFLEASRGTALDLAVNGAGELEIVQQEIDFMLKGAATGISGHLMLSVAFNADSEIPDVEALQTASGFILRGGTSGFPGATLLTLLAYATRASKSVTSYLPRSDWFQDLEDAVRFGLTRVVCSPEIILDVKDGIRGL